MRLIDADVIVFDDVNFSKLFLTFSDGLEIDIPLVLIPDLMNNIPLRLLESIVVDLNDHGGKISWKKGLLSPATFHFYPLIFLSNLFCVEK